MNFGKILGGASAVLAPLTVATTFGDQIYNSYASKKAQKAQNEWNLEQWERENAYNTPSEIMKRYSEANLNPNLIYQQSYEAPAHLESARRDTSSKLNTTSAILSLYNAELQNELLAKQIKETEARTSSTDTTNDLKELELDQLRKRKEFEEATGLDYNSPSGRVARFISSYFSPSSPSFTKRQSSDLVRREAVLNKIIRSSSENSSRSLLDVYNYRNALEYKENGKF